MTLSALETYFNSQNFKDNLEIKLCDGNYIKCVKSFVNSHISVLKANSGKKTYLPYYERLLMLYNILNNSDANR